MVCREMTCKNLPRNRSSYTIHVRQYRPDGSYTIGEQRIENTMSILCRQVGNLVGNEWRDLPECEGCNPVYRDWEFINESREKIKTEMLKGMQSKVRLEPST